VLCASYSAPGSFTHLFVQTISKELNIKPKLVQTGTMASARTMMMSGQTDTAWSGYPTNVDLIRSGEARIIGSGDDAERMRGLSPRGISANSEWLGKHRDIAVRLMRAMWKGQLYNFSGEKALRRYADHWKLDFEDVKGQVLTEKKRLLRFEGHGKSEGEPVTFSLDIHTEPKTLVEIDARFPRLSAESLTTLGFPGYTKFTKELDLDVQPGRLRPAR